MFRLYKDEDTGFELPLGEKEGLIPAVQDDDCETDMEILRAGQSECFRDLAALKQKMKEYGPYLYRTTHNYQLYKRLPGINLVEILKK